MAAGPARFIEMDTSAGAPDRWHLLKVPEGLQTAVTAAKLSQALRRVSFAEDNFDFADVSWASKIMVQVWGVGSNNHAPVLDIYGWSDNGPGIHVGQVTATMGNFVSEDSANASPGWHTEANLHPAMKSAFAGGNDYRSCDTYAATDYTVCTWADDTTTRVITYGERNTLWTPKVLTAAGIDTSPEDDFLSFFTVDLSHQNFKFLCLACTNLGSATSAGAIYRPISLR